MKNICIYRGRIIRAIVLSIFSVCFNGFLSPLHADTAPSSYKAYTGTDPKPAPPAPALGPANSVITDPTFGSRILRVTDQNTKSGQSFISTDSGFLRAWNADSTAIKLTGPHGDGYWLEFNPNTFKVGDGSSTPAVHPVPFGATWEWSVVDPDIIYYLNGNRIAKYNKSTGVSTDLGGPSNGDALGYMAVVIGMDNWVCAAAGPGVQNSRYKIFCLNPVSPAISKFIDVYNKTINGVPQGDPNWPTSAQGQVIGIHGLSGGTGSSWLEVTFHQQSWGGNGDSILNLATNTWSLVTNADPYWSGHVSMGNGKFANASGSADGRDSRGVLLRDPDNAMNSVEYKFVYQPPKTSNGWCDADHNSWLNSLTNPNAPILISRYGIGSSCYQNAWTGEINAAAVDGSNTVWRFAHNHNAGFSCYYGQAFAQISTDGKWALFSSYWDGTLGSDTAFGCSNRIDTFIVDLTGGISSSEGGGSTTSTGGSTGGTTTTGSTNTTGSTTTTTTNSSTTTPTATRTQQNGANVTYSGGTWATNTNSVHSGGSAVLSMDKGARATFTFNGTGATWIGYRDQWSGIANVYVDGVPKGTVDTYASPQQAQAANYSISGLSSGSHTLVIEAAGKRSASSKGLWIWVDAFDAITATTAGTTSTSTSISTASSSTTATRVEQNGPGVAYSGGTWFINTNIVHSAGSAVLSMDKGARSTFTFKGTGVSWIAYRDEWSGIANVYVDGVRKAVVDTYSTPYKAQAATYSVTGLSSGSHTLAIEVAGSHNRSSRGFWIWVDGFMVAP